MQAKEKQLRIEFAASLLQNSEVMLDSLAQDIDDPRLTMARHNLKMLHHEANELLKAKGVTVRSPGTK